jgi:hypothetical protein
MEPPVEGDRLIPTPCFSDRHPLGAPCIALFFTTGYSLAERVFARIAKVAKSILHAAYEMTPAAFLA